MKTPNLNLKLSLDLKSFVPLLLKRFSLVLWILLGLIMVAEAWVLKSSVDKVLTATDQSQFAGAQLVRVNFTAYEKIEERLNNNNQFLPPEPETQDPFGLSSD
jgi:hypothetical protein